MIYQITFILMMILCPVLGGTPPADAASAAADKTPDAAADTAGHLTETEISRLFHEANDLFAKANQAAAADPEKAMTLYRKSLLRYRKIAEQGNIENGRLYYNIANLYFKTRDIGRAILNYRKAEIYLGNDINLQKNLAFARQMRKDDIRVKQETKILKTVFFWHYDLSSKTRLFLFAGSFALFWGFAGIRIFIKRPAVKGAAVVWAVLAVLFGTSLIVEYTVRKNTVPGVVVSEKVVARKGNSRSYEPSFKDPLHAGTEFIVLEHRGNWIQVRLPDDRTCWLPAADVELVG